MTQMRRPRGGRWCGVVVWLDEIVAPLVTSSVGERTGDRAEEEQKWHHALVVPQQRHCEQVAGRIRPAGVGAIVGEGQPEAALEERKKWCGQMPRASPHGDWCLRNKEDKGVAGQRCLRVMVGAGEQRHLRVRGGAGECAGKQREKNPAQWHLRDDGSAGE